MNQRVPVASRAFNAKYQTRSTYKTCQMFKQRVASPVNVRKVILSAMAPGCTKKPSDQKVQLKDVQVRFCEETETSIYKVCEAQEEFCGPGVLNTKPYCMLKDRNYGQSCLGDKACQVTRFNRIEIGNFCLQNKDGDFFCKCADGYVVEDGRCVEVVVKTEPPKIIVKSCYGLTNPCPDGQTCRADGICFKASTSNKFGPLMVVGITGAVILTLIIVASASFVFYKKKIDNSKQKLIN